MFHCPLLQMRGKVSWEEKSLGTGMPEAAPGGCKGGENVSETYLRLIDFQQIKTSVSNVYKFNINFNWPALLDSWIPGRARRKFVVYSNFQLNIRLTNATVTQS